MSSVICTNSKKTMQNWTHEQLKSLGYHLHPDGQYYPQPPASKLSYPITQLNPLKPLVKTKRPQKKSKRRITVCIERVATRLQDTDNFIGGTKPLMDQLRYLKLIPDDDPESITAHYQQQKCSRKIDEKTIVRITYHSNTTDNQTPQAQLESATTK